ncbi:MAG: DUF4168 domain-containing protein [Phormidesmis sp. RL_2_1]|nr:DUF4168 domain-containing protein [Phormidesmis sp. RL_2_1]
MPYPNLSRRNRRLPRTALFIALGTIATVQTVSLLVPHPISGIVPAAQAQATSDEEISNYARAVIDIEVIRKDTYAAASDILVAAGSEADILETPLSCTATRISDMPDIPRVDRVDLRTALVNFCNEASQIAEANDLTPQRFNSITAEHREEPELAARIQTAMGELQEAN